MSDGVTLVLGWDGLDPELVKAFNLDAAAGRKAAFGAHCRKIDTLANPVIGKPHTRELWPTLITGLEPAEHGIRVEAPGDSLDWGHPVIDRASTLANGIMPYRLRAEIGRWLRNAGADLSDTSPADYQERGLTTVFDDRRSAALAIPNYWTETSADLGMTGSRKATFREFMRVSKDDGMVPREGTALPELEQRIWSAATQKLGAARAAIERDHDLVWVWLGYLDTVGHIAPSLDAGGIQERAYRQAAAWTEQMRAALSPEDTLICVSDHGLQDGEHTHHACLAADDWQVVDGVESVVDVRAAIEDVTGNAGTGAVRDAYRGEATGITADTDAVANRLEALGYIEGAD